MHYEVLNLYDVFYNIETSASVFSFCSNCVLKLHVFYDHGMCFVQDIAHAVYISLLLQPINGHLICPNQMIT